MNLRESLAQTQSAILRAEAEDFENTAAALKKLAIELQREISLCNEPSEPVRPNSILVKLAES